jgi:hypothetical protein
VATSTNDDTGVTISPSPSPGSFSDVTISPGALTLADEEFGVIYERGRTMALGEFAGVAFDAGWYTAGNGGVGGTWTVESSDVVTYGYALIGALMLICFRVDVTTVSGSPNTLNIRLPDGYAPTASVMQPIGFRDNGALGIGTAQVVAGVRTAFCYRNSGSGVTAWANAANNSGVWGAIWVPVSPALGPYTVGSPDGAPLS